MHADEPTKTQPVSPTELMESSFSPREAPLAPGYEVLEKLGEGGYGQVWLARVKRTGVRVAIKFFSHGTGLQWQFLQAEVRQLAQLHADPGIVQLIDVEPEASPPFYVMDLAEQGSLAKKLERGPLPIREALIIFHQVAEALAYVHAKGIRHCDLKPANILLDARGRGRIADFGQAHFSSDASPALGTFFYMAPEQADLASHIPDTRWDVYGLGALLYAMLTGDPPRQDDCLRDELSKTRELSHRLERYRQWVQKAPKPEAHRRVAGMDRSLAEIIDRCLEIDEGKRFRDAGAVLAALACRDRRQRRRPLLIFGFVAPLFLLLVMAGLAYWAINSAINESRTALTNQLLESDLVGARLVANAVEEEMVARRKLLERHAAGMDLRRAAQDKAAAELKRILQQFNEQQHERNYLSWMIVDETGNLLALEVNVPVPSNLQIPKQFGWRDWFNGQGDRFDQKTDMFKPISGSHISQPFVGKVTREMVVGISTPVFAPEDDKKVVGILYTSVLLEDIHRWLEKVTIQGGFAILVDERGYCLRHQEKQKIMPRPDQVAPRWSCPTYEAALRAEGTTPAYEDCVDHRTYLAGYAPLPQVGWGALVQHERELALQPVADLERQMIRLGWVMLAAVILLTSGLWGWLIWTLRREELLLQG